MKLKLNHVLVPMFCLMSLSASAQFAPRSIYCRVESGLENVKSITVYSLHEGSVTSVLSAADGSSTEPYTVAGSLGQPVKIMKDVDSEKGLLSYQIKKIEGTYALTVENRCSPTFEKGSCDAGKTSPVRSEQVIEGVSCSPQR